MCPKRVKKGPTGPEESKRAQSVQKGTECLKLSKRVQIVEKGPTGGHWYIKEMEECQTQQFWYIPHPHPLGPSCVRMTICGCASALIIGKPKMNYGRTSEGQKDREKRPTDRNTFYRGSQIRKGNRSVDFGPFLWLFFELLVLMTLTPYKHLVKHYFMF